MQIGEPSETARVTGCTVVSDFRTADVAHGGQGAPLTSTFDELLLRPDSGVRALLNIGGISNVTLLGPRSKGGEQEQEPYAFDTGNAAMLFMLLIWVLIG